MEDYELKAVITITGYENIRAASKEEAIKLLEEKLEQTFTFVAPLRNKSSETTVTFDEYE